MKIIIDDKIPFIKGILENYAEVDYIPGAKIKHQLVKDSDALIVRTRTECNKELLEGTNIKFIATATIGYDHIDTRWCEANGIEWTNAAGCNSTSVQQYISSVLAYLSKKYDFKFEDKTLGVVGVGNVGKKIVRLAETLGMRVILNDPPLARQRGPCGYISLDGLIHEADIITLHVPLYIKGEDRTMHLIDETKIKKFNPGTILINSSRGEVVDNSALKKALKKSILKGAVLDVWETEPNIDLDLVRMLDIATPHIAGYSADGKANGTAMSVRAISKFFNLGIDHWFPENIPSPLSPLITIDASDKSLQQVICEAIEKTYEVRFDDERLKKSPQEFETQRGDYPVRREFHAYMADIKNGRQEMKDRLRELGFKIGQSES
jgi:erythronate-4-phosphate dehydrogenase